MSANRRASCAKQTIVEHERIAAAEDHFLDRRVGGDLPKAGSQISGPRAAAGYGKCLRKQKRQWTQQVPFVKMSNLPRYFLQQPWTPAGIDFAERIGA